MSALYDPATGLPMEVRETSEEAAARHENRRQMLEALNPFAPNAKQYTPRSRVDSAAFKRVEPVTVARLPLPSRVEVIDPLADLPAEPATPTVEVEIAAEVTKDAEVAEDVAGPSVPLPRARRRRTVIHPSANGKTFIDPQTGDSCTGPFMDIVVGHFLKDRQTIAEIAATYKIREGFVRAILTFNRIPLVRNGRGPKPGREAA